jgi:DNA-directed RNA polymerase specialized sigma24 family protein
MDDIKNETLKAEEQMKKAWSVQTIMGTLNEEQTMLLSYFIHTSLQKGRILGKMEMDGRTTKEIADALQVPEDQVKVILEEDPFEVVK